MFILAKQSLVLALVQRAVDPFSAFERAAIIWERTDGLQLFKGDTHTSGKRMKIQLKYSSATQVKPCGQHIVLLSLLSYTQYAPASQQHFRVRVRSRGRRARCTIVRAVSQHTRRLCAAALTMPGHAQCVPIGGCARRSQAS